MNSPPNHSTACRVLVTLCLLALAGPAWADSAAQLAAQAEADFDEQLYRRCLQHLDEWQLAHGDLPFELDLLRSRATVRWKSLPDGEALRDVEIDHFLDLIEGGDLDETRAQAGIDLLPAAASGNFGPRIRQQLARVRNYWEAHLEPQRVRPDYRDLFEALLRHRNRGYTSESELASMWRNLVKAGMGREQVLQLAQLVFLGQKNPEISPLHMPRPAWGGTGELRTAVAREVLAAPAPTWLSVQAHVDLATDAQSRGDIRAAFEHLEWLADPRHDVPAKVQRIARERLVFWRESEARVEGSERYRPGSQHAVDLAWRNAKQWTLTVERLSPLEDLRLPGRLTTEVIPASWTDLTEFYRDSPGHEVFRLDQVDQVEARARGGDAREQPHRLRTRRIWIDPLPKGLYRVRLRTRGYDDEGATRDRLICVSSLGMQLHELGDQLVAPATREVWLVDLQSGRGLGGAQGRVLSMRGDEKVRASKRNFSVAAREFSTDSRGRADLGSQDLGRFGAIAVVAERNGEPVLGYLRGGLRTLRGASPPRWQGMAWTDRPIYRPGERVHVQTVWRSVEDLRRRIEVPEGTTVEVRVSDPQREVVFQKNVNLDDNGSADLDFELGEAANLGPYRVEVRTSDPVVTAVATLQVEEVRWPEYQVDVSVDAGFRPVLGDSLHVVVAAEYLFGSPVEGRATVEVSRRPRWRYWRPTREQSTTRMMKSIRPAPHSGVSAPLLHQELTLDENGRAELHFATAAASEQLGWEYLVEVSVIDNARRTERGRASIVLNPEALSVSLYSDQNVVVPGGTAEFLLHVEDNLGQTDEVTGRWTLLRQDGDEWSVVRSDSVTTTRDGDSKLAVRIEEAGSYRLGFEIEDGRGGWSRGSSDLWCAGPNVRTLGGWEGGLRLIPVSESFRGNSAKVLLLNDAPGTDVMLTRSFAGGASAEVVRMNGTARWIEIPLGPRERPRCELEALRGFDYRWASATATLECPDAQRELRLELAFDEQTTRPGTSAQLRMRARDWQGNPVATVFALSVIDDAVLRIRGRDELSLTRFASFVPSGLPRATEFTTVAGQMIQYYGRDARDGEDTEFGVGGVRNEGQGMPSPGLAFSRGPEMADSMMEESSFAKASATGAESTEAPVLREDFRATALWRTGIRTDADGRASIAVPLASSLTRWSALAVAIDPQTRVGTAETTVRTALPLMVRLQHPRVLREGDRVSVAAIVVNTTDQDVDATLTVDLGQLDTKVEPRPIRVAAHDQLRVEWQADVPPDVAELLLQRDASGRPLDVVPSSMRLSATVTSAVGGDAVAHELPLVPAGTPLRVVAHALLEGKEPAGHGDSPSATAWLDFELPTQRTAGSDLVLAHVTPSVLGGCVQALPYLANFPQGCTEQTLSRFVPAVAVRAVAGELGFDASRIDPQLDEKIGAGLARIRHLALADGSWPWWKGGPGNSYMTAYAVRSLALAHEFGVEGSRRFLDAGRRALQAQYYDRGALDDRAYALNAMALASRQLDRSWAWNAPEAAGRTADFLYEERDQLHAGARALLAQVEEYRGNHSRALALLAHLGNDRHQAEDGSIYWGDPRASWRGQNAVESTAFVLEALALVDPQSPWRDGAARWLMLNREGRRWHSTRETAHAVIALVRHVAQRGQREAMEGRVVFRLGGQEVGRLDLDLDAVLEGRLSLPLDAVDLKDGANRIDVELTGAGPVWISLEANTFTRQRDLRASEGNLRITREMVELRPVQTLGGWIARAEDPLEVATLHSGDWLRVKLRLHAVHDLDFVRIQDPRAAGLVPVDRLSGVHSASGLWVRREVGRDRTEFFIDHLPAGDHELTYDLVVERPGDYYAGPARIDGMYLPTRAGHSSSQQMRIE